MYLKKPQQGKWENMARDLVLFLGPFLFPSITFPQVWVFQPLKMRRRESGMRETGGKRWYEQVHPSGLWRSECLGVAQGRHECPKPWLLFRSPFWGEWWTLCPASVSSGLTINCQSHMYKHWRFSKAMSSRPTRKTWVLTHVPGNGE